MKIEKRGENSYRIRKMYKGKMYTVNFEYKPTQKEAMLAMATELERVKSRSVHLDFVQAADNYVDMKRNILSPRTIKEYSETAKRIPEWFCKLPLSDVDQIQINRLVNELARDKSPKTVRNYHGFITAVLGTFCPNLRISTTLPQKIKKEPYVPSQGDIKSILAEAKGTQYEIPLMLACYGMRRSEICALQLEDIEGDVVHISKAMVLNEENEWIIKKTKTTESTRDLVIPMELADMIRKQGHVYKGHPGSITKFLKRTEKELGISDFPLHKLRHYFASRMSDLGVPEADILKMGGWETDHVMKSVYRHSMMDREEQAKREAAQKMRGDIF